MPNPFTRGPLTEEQYRFIEQGEMEEAVAGGYQVKVERLTVAGKLFARVTYPS